MPDEIKHVYNIYQTNTYLKLNTTCQQFHLEKNKSRLSHNCKTYPRSVDVNQKLGLTKHNKSQHFKCQNEKKLEISVHISTSQFNYFRCIGATDYSPLVKN